MHGTHNVTLTHCNMMHGTHNVTLTHCNMMHGTHVTLTHCNMMHGTHTVKETPPYSAQSTSNVFRHSWASSRYQEENDKCNVNNAHANKIVTDKKGNISKIIQDRTCNKIFTWILLSFPCTAVLLLHAVLPETTRGLQTGNACWHSTQNLPSSSFLTKNININIHRTIILPVVFYGYETWSLALTEACRLC